MTLVLDSGAFIALERNDRAMWRRLKATHLAGNVPLSHGGVVGQVWRGGGPRQALLAKALDAALVLLAEDGDDIVTADPQDIEPLAATAGRHVELIHA